MINIRSVTTKPPTMLIDAKTTATRPNTRMDVDCAVPATRIAPIKITPWMALAPDISGVCKVAETLEITSTPTKMARMKIVNQIMGSVLNCSLRSLRIALWSPPTSSSLADGEACPLTPPQHDGARSGIRLLAPLCAHSLPPAWLPLYTCPS
jgi:hypothetical protein